MYLKFYYLLLPRMYLFYLFIYSISYFLNLNWVTILYLLVFSTYIIKWIVYFLINFCYYNFIVFSITGWKHNNWLYSIIYGFMKIWTLFLATLRYNPICRMEQRCCCMLAWVNSQEKHYFIYSYYLLHFITHFWFECKYEIRHVLWILKYFGPDDSTWLFFPYISF